MEHFITNSFKDLLHKTAKEQNFVDYNLDIKEISSGGANYTSKLFAVSITEGSNTLRLFCKVAAIGEKMRAQLAKIFTTEHFFYTNLGKMYKNIEDYCGIPDELKLNVSKQDPEGFEYVKKKLLYDINMDESDTEVYATKMIGNAVNILLLQEKKDKLIKYFETLDPDTYKMMQKTSRRLVLCHGDYKPSNLMHKILEDGTVDIKVVDLQTMQAGSPIVDLLYFIIAGTDEKFRAQYFDKLLDHYYSELSAAMKRLQLNPDETFSREDFDCEVKEKLPYGLLLAVFVLPVLTVEMENAPQVDESLDISKFNMEKTSDLYAERLNGIVNDYVKWGILK